MKFGLNIMPQRRLVATLTGNKSLESLELCFDVTTYNCAYHVKKCILLDLMYVRCIVNVLTSKNITPSILFHIYSDS